MCAYYCLCRGWWPHTDWLTITLSKHALQYAEEEHEVDVTVGGKLTDSVLLGCNSISSGCPSLYIYAGVKHLRVLASEG